MSSLLELADIQRQEITEVCPTTRNAVPDTVVTKKNNMPEEYTYTIGGQGDALGTLRSFATIFH